MSTVTPADLAQSGTMLLTTALHLREDDRFVVVCDAESTEITTALTSAAERLGADVTVARLDLLRSVSTNHSGERPHKVLPDVVRRAMLAAQASVFVATTPQKENGMRDQLLHIVGACRVRHAHMPGISARAFAAGMRVDYGVVEGCGREIERRLEGALTITVESDTGTNLVCTLTPKHVWTAHLGRIAPGEWSLLPAGALYTVPASVDGTFVANAALGEFFGAREGLLTNKPVRFTLEAGRVTNVEAELAPALEKDVRAMLGLAPGSDRVGLVALGLNAGIEEATGIAAVDENLPGLHLVLGDAAGRVRASTLTARTSFVACAAGARVRAGEDPLVDGGKITRPR